jgi:2-keto-3-deoxy-L-rhamnonate aldolase RhmA
LSSGVKHYLHVERVGGIGAPAVGRSLRTALREGPPLLATFVLLPRVEVIELLAAAGFGAVLIDLEHAPIDIGDLPPLAAAAQGAGVYAIARVAGGSEAEIGKALDTGVDGVLAPHVSSRKEAERVARAGRFPPAGERSLNPYVRGTAYGLRPEDGLADVDARVALMAMLEGPDVLTNLGDLCDVDGLDALFVGPVDLAASLGFDGQAEHPEVIDAVADAIRRIREADCVAGVYAPTPEAAARWMSLGAGLVALSADVAMAGAAFAAARTAALMPAGAVAAVSDSGLPA